MNIYRFSIKNNQLVCLCAIDDTYNEVYGEDALKILSTIKNLEYKKAVISKNKIKFKTNNITIVLEDLNQMIDKNYFHKYLSNLVSSAKKAITLYQLDKIKNKTISNVKMHNKKIIAGTMILSILIGNSIKVTEIENTIDNEVIDEYNNDLSIQDRFQDTNNNGENALNLEFANISNNEKELYVRDNYQEIIDFYSSKWGVDSKLVTAILTQESGGKQSNLMQIEFNAWKDQEITAYNFYDNEYVTICLTDNPELHDSTVMCISENDLLNPKTNISVGTILLAYNLKHFNYNIPIAITSYNCGTYTMSQILDTMASNENILKNEIINDSYNLNFLNYRYIMNNGDNEYFEHVIRYIPNYDEDIIVKDENNNIHNIKLNYKTTKTI